MRPHENPMRPHENPVRPHESFSEMNPSNARQITVHSKRLLNQTS